jgi:hypothetical protein
MRPTKVFAFLVSLAVLAGCSSPQDRAAKARSNPTKHRKRWPGNAWNSSINTRLASTNRQGTHKGWRPVTAICERPKR